MTASNLGNNDSAGLPQEPQKKQRRSGWFRWLRRLLVFLLVVLFLPVLLFQLPPVQNFAARQLTAYLSKEIGTVVSLERVMLNVFYEIRLEKLYVEDLNGDTLLYAGLLDVDHAGLYRLVKKELEIESLSLSDVEVHIGREAGQEFQNYQFLVDYFASSQKKKPKKEKKSPFVFDLNHLLLNNVRFLTPDALRGETIGVQLSRLEADFRSFDLLKNNIIIQKLNIYGPELTLDQYEHPPDNDSTSTEPVATADSLAPADTLKIFVENFNLTGGAFRFSNRRKEPVRLTPDGEFNPNHLEVFDINLHFRDFALNDELEFHGIIDSTSMRERNGFILQNLAAKDATLDCNGLSLYGMELRTPQTLLGDTLIFRYRKYEDWENFPYDVRMDLRFNEQAYLSLKDIMTFAPGLEKNTFFKENKEQQVNISGRLSGPVDRLDGRDLKINLAGGVQMEGSFSTIGLTEKDEQFLRLKLDRLQTNVRTLRKLIPGFAPPENFNHLGNLDFSGNFDGFFVDFVANGRLVTDIGTATMDVNMKLRDGRENAKYSGDLRLFGFNLGTWSGDKNFGKISLVTEVKDGIGLTLQSAEAKVKGTIDSLVFKNYVYKNVRLDGELKRNLFNGDLTVEDKNINLNFGGVINFADSIPSFDFQTDIRRLSLKNLNLSKNDLQFSGKANLQVQGKRLSDVVGNAELTSFEVIKNRKDTLLLDQATLASTLSANGEKDFTLRSNLGNVDITGRFDIEKIPGTFLGFLHTNYPRFAQKLGLVPKNTLTDSMNFDYKVELFALQNLVSFFDEKINGFDKTLITGAYNGSEGKLSLEVEIPAWSYENIAFNDVYARAKLNRNEGNLQLGVVSTQLGENRKLSPVSLIGTLYGDTLEFLVISSNFFKILDNININGLLSLEDDQAWRISFKPSDLVVLNQIWNIDTSNYVRIGEGRVETRNFQLHNGDQKITLRSFQNQGLELQLRNVPLQSVDFIRNIENHKLDGVANLDLQAENVFKLTGLSAFFQVKDLNINGDNFGLLQLNARAASVKDQLDLGLSIIGDTTSLAVKGYLNLPTYEPPAAQTPTKKYGKNHFDVQVDLNKIPVSIIRYFVAEVLEPKGSLSAQAIHLHGPFERPEMDGLATVNDVSFRIKPLQTTYRVPQGSVKLTSKTIDATGTWVYDRYKNKALLKGGLTHRHFADWGLDMVISTEPDKPFLGLETTEADNATFYGTAFGSGSAKFSGNFQQPRLEVTGRSMSGTHMYLPLTGNTISQDNRFIRFTEEERKKETLEGANSQAQELRGLEMEFAIYITPEAQMEVIFDRTWGDVLSGAGEGLVTVKLERNGNFTMHGNVEVVRGDYLFTMMKLGLNKPFTVGQGGIISWGGDPYNADINIKATYSGVNASTYSLIQEYISVASSETQDRARRSTPVELTMNLSGKLLKPDIKFDISFLNLDSELKSFADNKLRAIRQDENELNRQVFGLLVLGQFLPSGSAIQAGDIGFNTMGEMLSNQLSIFVTQWVQELVAGTNFIKGIDVKLSVNRFTTEDISTADINRNSEYGGRIRIILNDRIAVNLGTEYGVGNTSGVSTINNGQWAGEFELELTLTKDGRLVSKIYSTFDPDIFGSRRNKFGAKLLFRKEFDTVSELFGWAKRKGKG